ncbi:uncharacterized protein BDR25DRAFT_306174 [Lindgomyces ingoldianus]|uniref:Uncharacterized protein n=1 Tax=Lindgomyces ingoldianus TaxID=673940 RepID=A0ACB6QJN9_9PLEO|nr:uncharacterized protein BDR25DRAFT_306174 [Lindgomyces ingoldianus]KAF2466355.1 hypothetical protein BDR25DRAFT_306174 [Lindgomyces ingoldianus]
MSLQTRVLAGITVPDTPLITKAIAFARRHMDDQGYKHVVRSWLTGQAIISHLPPPAQQSIDLEAYALSTILHDLGWSKSPELISKDKCFEVDSANAAREFLLREGEASEWNKHRIQLVWDAIALHSSPQIAAFKESEVALANAGIFTELLGVDVSKQLMGGVVGMSQQEFDGIAKEFPREGLRGYLREIMCGLCRTKPETTYLNFVSGFGERFVEGYSLEGKKVVDMMETYVTE